MPVSARAPRSALVPVAVVLVGGLALGTLGERANRDEPTAGAHPATPTATAPPSPSTTALEPTAPSTEGAPATTEPTDIPTEVPPTTVVPTTQSAPPPEPPPPPNLAQLPTEFLTVEKSISDPDLGHQITVTKMARAMSWPPSSGGQEQAFELVGLELRWTPTPRYTAALRTIDFTIATTSQFPNRPDKVLDPSLYAAGWLGLPDQLTAAQLPPGQTSITGWLIFKVDPKNASTLRLDYTRPPTRVTDTGQTLPRRVFSVDLVTPPPAPPAAPAAPAAPTPPAGPAPAATSPGP